ncbi:hypothetical protein JCM11251_005781 [Rhodosporidiobolus azoricus]
MHSLINQIRPFLASPAPAIPTIVFSALKNPINHLLWESGLPQGSPLSPILFLLYNVALLRHTNMPSSCGFGWVDDVNLLAWGPSVPAAVAAAQALIPALEEWSDSHHSAFEPDKTTVTIFHPPHRRLPPNPPPVILRGQPLTFSSSLTLLGTELDSTLSFAAHQARCAAKAATAMTGVLLLSKAKGGLKPAYVRQLVRAVVEPRLTWMAEVEANLPPLDLVIHSLSFRLALRALTASPAHLLHESCRLARPTCPLRHASPIYNALHAFPSLLPPSLLVEPLLPWPIVPWSPAPSYTTSIAPSRDEALTSVPKLLASLPPASLVGFSDGSLMDGHTGAASAVWTMGAGEAAHTSLRVMGGQQTVWAGEAEGAQLTLLTALPLIQLHYPPTLTLLIDNQALLLAPHRPLALAGPAPPAPAPLPPRPPQGLVPGGSGASGVVPGPWRHCR